MKVKLKIEAEHGSVRVPNNVSAWTNLADGEYVVAVMGALDAVSGPSDTQIELVDRRVVNEHRRPRGEADHHKSYGYLRTPEFSRIARWFVEPTRRIERPRKALRSKP